MSFPFELRLHSSQRPLKPPSHEVLPGILETSAQSLSHRYEGAHRELAGLVSDSQSCRSRSRGRRQQRPPVHAPCHEYELAFERPAFARARAGRLSALPRLPEGGKLVTQEIDRMMNLPMLLDCPETKSRKRRRRLQG